MKGENAMSIVDLPSIKTFCQEILNPRLDQKGAEWLKTIIGKMESNPVPREFYMNFNLAPRFVGKSKLNPTEKEIEHASQLNADLRIEHWSVDIVARNLILLHLPFDDKATSLTILKNLYETAGLEDAVALYSGLSLLPIGPELAERGAEGIRTNMVAVFEAIALNNPYPKDYFSEIAWNQMVLKAFFMERPVYKIIGISERHNRRLAAMISDYAHERWAANRVTMPEMWRFVVNFVDEVIVEDLRKMLQSDDELQQKAAALACHESNHALAKELLEKYSSENKRLSPDLTWMQIGKNWEARQIQKETLYE